MKMEEWNKEYKALGFNATWGDANKLVYKLDKTQLKQFIKVHEKVKEITGLDMRQEFFLSLVRAELNTHNF